MSSADLSGRRIQRTLKAERVKADDKSLLLLLLLFQLDRHHLSVPAVQLRTAHLCVTLHAKYNTSKLDCRIHSQSTSREAAGIARFSRPLHWTAEDRSPCVVDLRNMCFPQAGSSVSRNGAKGLRMVYEQVYRPSFNLPYSVMY